MGVVERGLTVAPFEFAVFRLRVGEVSEPVKTEYGYHLIRVDKIRLPGFEAVRRTLENELAQQKLKEIVKAAQLSQEYFGPEAPQR